MPAAFYVMLASGLALLLVSLLFRSEERSGRRFILGGLRERADAYIERSAVSFLGVKKVMGGSSLRLFLHYVLHQILGAVLFIINFVEDRLHRLRAKNKVVAKDIRAKSDDSHLARVAEHKSAVSLSPEEKERIREQSLEH